MLAPITYPAKTFRRLPAPQTRSVSIFARTYYNPSALNNHSRPAPRPRTTIRRVERRQDRRRSRKQFGR
jgi:hypothetical protein